MDSALLLMNCMDVFLQTSCFRKWFATIITFVIFVAFIMNCISVPFHKSFGRKRFTTGFRFVITWVIISGWNVWTQFFCNWMINWFWSTFILIKILIIMNANGLISVILFLFMNISYVLLQMKIHIEFIVTNVTNKYFWICLCHFLQMFSSYYMNFEISSNWNLPRVWDLVQQIRIWYNQRLFFWRVSGLRP